MRLKYYLRGLGLGIIFAVFIMMVGSNFLVFLEVFLVRTSTA